MAHWRTFSAPIALSGQEDGIVTRAYHLYALPANRLRVATDWFNDVIEHRQFVRLGLIGDRVIPPAELTFMAQRAGARITDVNAGHLSLISKPSAVTRVILQAVRATR